MAVTRSIVNLSSVITRPSKQFLNLYRPRQFCFNAAVSSSYVSARNIKIDLTDLKKSSRIHFSTEVPVAATESKQSEEYDKLFRLVEVECRGAEPAVLKSYHKFVTAAANHLEITIGSAEFPRYHAHRLTLLKSVFIHKKHRVQYEIRTHFLIMKFLRLTSSTSDTFLEYIQRNLPEGVSMKVTTEELCHLPPHVKASDKVRSYEET